MPLEQTDSQGAPASALQPALELGAKVEVDGGRTGIIRFIGHVHYKTGPFYGIELTDGSLGNNDGSVGKDRYFVCKAKCNQAARWRPGMKKAQTVALRGIFVRRFKIRKVIRAPNRPSSPIKRKRPPRPSERRAKEKTAPGSPRNMRRSRGGNLLNVEKPPLRQRSKSIEACPPTSRKRKPRKRPCKVCGVDLNFWEPLADQVMDHVLLGGFPQSQDGEGLETSKVTHVLNCARELPNCFPDVLQYLQMQWADSAVQKISDKLEDCFKFLDDCQQEGGVCLVHCQQGKSRSVAVVAAYLVARRGLSLHVAMERIKAVRPIACPNDNFMAQLRDFERAAKRWRRNPDPKLKRLYALQSVRRPSERHGRGSSKAPNFKQEQSKGRQQEQGNIPRRYSMPVDPDDSSPRRNVIWSHVEPEESPKDSPMDTKVESVRSNGSTMAEDLTSCGGVSTAARGKSSTPNLSDCPPGEEDNDREPSPLTLDDPSGPPSPQDYDDEDFMGIDVSPPLTRRQSPPHHRSSAEEEVQTGGLRSDDRDRSPSPIQLLPNVKFAAEPDRALPSHASRRRTTQDVKILYGSQTQPTSPNSPPQRLPRFYARRNASSRTKAELSRRRSPNPPKQHKEDGDLTLSPAPSPDQGAISHHKRKIFLKGRRSTNHRKAKDSLQTHGGDTPTAKSGKVTRRARSALNNNQTWNRTESLRMRRRTDLFL